MLLVTLVAADACWPRASLGRRHLGSRAVATPHAAAAGVQRGLGWYRLFEESRLKGNGLVAAFHDSDLRFTIEGDGLLRFQNAVTGT